MKSIYIVSACVSFLAGVFAGAIFDGKFLLIEIVIFFVISLFRKSKIFTICVLFLLIGLVRYFFAVPNIDENSIHYYRNENRNTKIRGIIALDPDRRREKVNYIINVDSVFIDGNWKLVNGRILLSYPLYPEFEYRERLEITGRLIEPPEFDNFSYKNYLSLFGVYSIVRRPYISRLDESSFTVKGVLFSFKNIFEYQLNRLFPEPSASFEAGLLTGSRKGIPDDLLEAFNITGLTHIIAISGYNISLIIILISSLFKNFSRRVKVPFVIIFIILFTIFVGASAAVVRASIMGIISVMALWFGRQSQVVNALLISAFIMILWNPMTLLYDVGFQLSFLATLGLIVMGNKILLWVSFMPERFGIKEAFAMTLSAQIFALPIILVNFGRFSLISPVANILIVPLIPFAMFFGFVAVALSPISFNLAFIIAMPAWLVLEMASFTTKMLSRLPMAAWQVPWFNYMYVIGYYFLCLFAYFVYPYFRTIFYGRRRFNVNRLPISNIKGVRNNSGSGL